MTNRRSWEVRVVPAAQSAVHSPQPLPRASQAVEPRQPYATADEAMTPATA